MIFFKKPATITRRQQKCILLTQKYTGFRIRGAMQGSEKKMQRTDKQIGYFSKTHDYL
jgi:hypothetical protein